MPRNCQRLPKFRFQFIPTQKRSTLDRLPVLEALAQQFGLWEQLRRMPGRRN